MSPPALPDGSAGLRARLAAAQARVAQLPLRTQLVAGAVVLSALGLAVAGVAAAAALRAYLVDRVDAQLVQAAPLLARYAGGPGPEHGDRPGRPPTEYYGVLLDTAGGAARLLASPASTSGSPQLPRLDLAATGRRAAHPFSVASSDGGPGWRVLALPAVDEQTGSPLGTVVVASRLSEVERAAHRLELLELGVGLAVLVLLGVAGDRLIRRALRPLVEVERTAAAIADGDLARRVPPADPRTEVGQLAGALNTMLAQIESAFAERAASEAAARASEDRMRRFVGDASHELRTPLTSIRGFAELYRQGAVEPGPPLDRALGRIEAEASRMGALVDDLLLLARLDQQRPLDLRPLDVRPLLHDAAEDLRALSPERPVELVEPEAPLPVAADEARLRQVLGNLVANASRHTPAGTRVRLGGRVEGDEVVLEVADDGPGLATDDAARVFERFYRVDGARARDSGGSGLGLALVAAVVQAHGGRVELETAPGAGAAFRVRLPRVALPAPA